MLAQRIVNKFGKVSTAFRAFDIKTRGFVTFSDFAYVIDQLKLGFERDVILQIFTYMDSDSDMQLKYRDFCNLCAETVLEPTNNSTAGFSKTGSDFSKIIKSLKSKAPDNRGRGGPNFINKRGQSARGA